jgi:hypothetical protein
MLLAVCGLKMVVAMAAAGVAYENRLLLNCVSPLAVRGTGIDSVLVIEASADGITFDNLVTHLE